ATEYVENMYGENTASTLHVGVGTDRFVVAWPITEPAPAHVLGERTAQVAADAPLLTDRTADAALLRAPVVRIEIPCDIAALQARDVEEAAEWRQRTRRAFHTAVGEGFRVAGFYRDATAGRCFYALVHSPSQSPRS